MIGNEFQAQLSQLEILRMEIHKKKPRKSINSSNSLVNPHNFSVDEIITDSINNLSSIVELKERRKSFAKSRDRVDSYQNARPPSQSVQKDLHQNVDNLVAEWNQHKGHHQAIPPSNFENIQGIQNNSDYSLKSQYFQNHQYQTLPSSQRQSIPELTMSSINNYNNNNNISKNNNNTQIKQAIWELPEFMELTSPIKTYITFQDEDLLTQGEMFDEPQLLSCGKTSRVSNDFSHSKQPLLSARNSYQDQQLPILVKQLSDQKLNPNGSKLTVLVREKKMSQRIQSILQTNLKTETSMTLKQTSKVTKQTQLKPSTPNITTKSIISKQTLIQYQKTPITSPIIQKQHLVNTKKIDNKPLKTTKDNFTQQQEFNLLILQVAKLKKDISSFYDKQMKSKRNKVIDIQQQLQSIQDDIKQDLDDFP